MALMNNNLIWAVGSVDGDAVAPVFFVQRGFASTAIVRNAAGDYTLTLEQEIDALQSACLLSGRQAVAASGMITMGHARPADATVRTTCAQEAAMGGASTLVDLDYNICVIAIPLSF